MKLNYNESIVVTNYLEMITAIITSYPYSFTIKVNEDEELIEQFQWRTLLT